MIPVVNEAWEAESRRQIEKLDGDGCCDSPGHCAKYGTYTLMGDDTGDVVAFNVVQVSEVTSSNAMEKEGFSRYIEMLDSNWSGNTYFHMCSHSRISSSKAERICWLKPGSPAHLALEELVLDPKLLKDLARLTDFCHTSRLEVYHSIMLKYCSKREHFSYQGMVARTQLAALGNNANTGHHQAHVQAGEGAGEARYKICFPKAHRR